MPKPLVRSTCFWAAMELLYVAKERDGKKFLEKKGNKEMSFDILSPAHNSPIDVL